MTGVAKEAFQVLLRYNYTVKMYDEDGMDVAEPADARRMFAASPNLMVSLMDADDDSSIKLLFGKSTHANDIDGLMQALRTTATKYNMTFDPKQYGKEIDTKDYHNLISVSESKDDDMHICEGMYGTSRSSYLQLDHAKLVVQHRGRIDPRRLDQRGTQIAAIFVENAAGERFRFPTNNLPAARALTEHLNAGGKFSDSVARAAMVKKQVTASTLAENHPVIRDFMNWTERFAPDRALLEWNDPYNSYEGDVETATNSAIDDFDPQDFLCSDDAQDILNGEPGSEDNFVCKSDLMAALDSYLRKHIELHDGTFQDGFNEDLHDMAKSVYEEVAKAVEHAGYTIEDDVDEDVMSNGGPPSSGWEDDISMIDEMGDGVITREDVLLPDPNQGVSLGREVNKSVVHDDPVDPDAEHAPGSSYIERMRALAGMQSYRPF
jgi:hypothetical protein